jgi:type IV secretion system protein VirB6
MITDIFSQVNNLIEVPFLAQVDALIGVLVAWLAGPMATALVIYVALTGFMMMRGLSQETFAAVLGRIVRLCIVAWIVMNAATYNTLVRDLFLTTLPTELADQITSSTGNTVPSAAAFDTIWRKALGIGMSVWSTLGWTDIGPSLAVIFMWVCAGVAISFSYLVWLTSRIGMGLVIAMGPIFVALALFPATRALFERWLGQVVQFVVLGVLAVTLLQLMVAAEGMLVDQIVATSATSSPAQRLQMLLAVCVLFIICAMLAMQLPGLASGLASGFSFHTGSLARLTFGKAIGAARSLPDARARGAAVIQAGAWTAATTRRALTGSGGNIRPRLPTPPSRLP